MKYFLIPRLKHAIKFNFKIHFYLFLTDFIILLIFMIILTIFIIILIILLQLNYFWNISFYSSLNL